MKYLSYLDQWQKELFEQGTLQNDRIEQTNEEKDRFKRIRDKKIAWDDK